MPWKLAVAFVMLIGMARVLLYQFGSDLSRGVPVTLPAWTPNGARAMVRQNGTVFFIRRFFSD